MIAKVHKESKLKKILCYGWLMLICPIAFSMNHAQGLRLQVGQNFFEITRSNTEQALVAIMPDKKAAILIKLKPEAARQLNQISQTEIGQTVMWIWNGKIIGMKKISTALDKDLTVFNFDPDEAEHFVKSLK